DASSIHAKIFGNKFNQRDWLVNIVLTNILATFASATFIQAKFFIHPNKTDNNYEEEYLEVDL
ncbi:hypothetical protein RhiirB3_461599, partial [Rhizophagus irregularis]